MRSREDIAGISWVFAPGDAPRRRTSGTGTAALSGVCIGLALGCALLASSCAHAEKEPPPPFEMPAAFAPSGEEALPDRWWLAFGDERLDELVRIGLAQNPGLQAVWDRLDRAAAIVDFESSSWFPALDYSASAGRGVTRVLDDGRSYENAFSVGAAATYEVDLWGRISSQVGAARFEATASASDVRAAAITLTAAIAETWYLLAEQHARVALIESQIATNEQALAVLRLRFRRGLSRAEDVLRQEQLIETRQGDLTLSLAARDTLTHRLAVLLGLPPSESPTTDSAAPAPRLIELPPLPAAGLPLELVARRPDLLAARHRIAASRERVAAAISNRYPRLTISATAETTADELADLFDDWEAALIAGIIGPLFDGGLRQAEVEIAKAEARELLHLYWESILIALQDVEDALARERRQIEFVESLARQIDLSRQVIEQSRANYRNGVADYLGVLDALRTHQILEREALVARLDLVLIRISLCRALAGGWDLEPREPEGDPDDAR